MAMWYAGLPGKPVQKIEELQGKVDEALEKGDRSTARSAINDALGEFATLSAATNRRMVGWARSSAIAARSDRMLGEWPGLSA